MLLNRKCVYLHVTELGNDQIDISLASMLETMGQILFYFILFVLLFQINEEKKPFQHHGTLECFNNGGLRYF